MDSVLAALTFLLDPIYWVVMLGVVMLAALTSIIPGTNAFLVMALAFPLILFEVEDPAIGLVALATISGVSNTLDSVPAILIGQPSAATQVTFLEGHQLARQGKAAHTLGAVYTASAIGGITGAIILMLLIPVARPWVLSFGFAEIGSTAIFGIALIVILCRGAMVKGLIAALIGMLLAIIGDYGRLTVDPFVRMPLIPFVLGLFALPELIDLMISRQPVAIKGADVSKKEVLHGARYAISRWKMILRQSAFGVLLGAIPGIGSSVVDWLSYAFGITFTKDRSLFGKGSLDGVLFAESAQNAKEAGAALPTLSLGIPGAPTWALVVTAMIPYGIAPGPEMLGRNAHITILLVITLALSNLFIAILGLGMTGYISRLTTIKYPIIGSVVIPLVLLSAFVDTTSWRGIQIVLGVSVMGLVMKKYGWPRPPMILGFILEPIIEKNFLSAFSLYGFQGTFTRPLTFSILMISLLFGFYLLRNTRTQILDGASSKVPINKRLRGMKLLFSPSIIIPVVTMIGVTILLMDHLRNPLREELRFTGFPFWLSVFAIALLLVEIGTSVKQKRVGASTFLMDLGIVSSGAQGLKLSAIKVLLLFAGFLLVGTTMGLNWAALAFAFMGPILLLDGRNRIFGAMLTTLCVGVFIYTILDNLLFVIYPEPFLRELIFSVG